MDLFTYLMAKNGNNSSVHGDLFSYLLGKGQSQIQTESGVTIYIPDAKKTKIVELIMDKESTQEGTPTPENPQTVNTVKGYRNLLDINSISTKKFIEISDGSLQTSNSWNATDYIEIKENTNYILSGTTNSGSAHAGTAFYDENKVFISSVSSTTYLFTTPANAKYMRISLSSSNLTTVMLNEGSTPLFYVSYGNNYINTKVVGKNKYNKLNVNWYRNNLGDFDAQANSSTTRIRSNSFEIEGGKTYTISGYPSNMSIITMRAFDENKNYSVSYMTRDGDTFTLDEAVKYIFVMFGGENFSNETNILMKNADIQIEIGSTATTYEEYKENNVPIPLNNNELVGKNDNLDELIVDKNGNCYINKVFDKIDSYNGETITTDYWSTTGGLDTGATIYYVMNESQLIDLNANVDIKLYKGTNTVSNSEDCNMTIKYF